MPGVFRSRKMLVIALLGFSSGLPLSLTGRAMQAWMTVSGVNLGSIGLFSLVGLPYSIKFLWAPFVDRFSIPGFGRRKGWLFVSQAGLIVAIAAMSIQDPSRALSLIAINAIIIAALSATQDIVVDAYRADILEPRETAAGAGAGVLGYRVAMIASGAAALVLADRFSWPNTYLIMAGLMGATLVMSLPAPEPPLNGSPPESLGAAVRLPLTEYFERVGWSRGAGILAFIVLFRLGDAMLANMTTPFLIQAGFTQTDVGAIQGGVGLIASIAGALVGGGVASRIGLVRALWIFGGLQALSNLAYLVLANSGHNYGMMVATVVVENFCTGLGSSTLVGFLMTLCNPRFSATQYALLSSVMAVGRDLLVAPSGLLAQWAGWPLFFLISVVAAVPGMALLSYVAPRGETNPQGS